MNFDCSIADEDTWNNIRSVSPLKSLFLNLEWCDLVASTLKAEFLPLLVSCGEKPVCILAIFRNGATFRIGGIGYGGPCPTDFDMAALFKTKNYLKDVISVIERELTAACSSITTIPHPIWANCLNYRLTVTQVLSIDRTPEKMFEEVLSGNVRTAIRKGYKDGITVRNLSNEELHSAHHLLETTQEQVGATYRTSLELLQSIQQLTTLSVDFLGAFAGSKLVSMGIFLGDTHEMFHLFNGWDRNASSSCPNQAVLWEALCIAHRRGAIELNLGESHTQPLFVAKERWGAQQVPLLRIASPLDL